jgi:hypothetical protein
MKIVARCLATFLFLGCGSAPVEPEVPAGDPAALDAIRWPCSTNRDCLPTQVCAFPVGVCGADTLGRCIPRGACRFGAYPVCGCDARTYPSTCAAAAAGVRVRHRGACERRCSPDRPCPSTHFCDYDRLSCGADGMTGVCRERPRVCPLALVCTPTCGCDGRDYCNACEAAAAGTDVAREGACDGRACRSSFDCGARSYCDFPAGTCGGEGECRARPEACTLQYDPVCGCDGRTHGNACSAASAGVDVAHDGPYEQGVCRPRPRVCPLYFVCLPTCGCDGRLYCNDCEAAAAGTDVRSGTDCGARE